MSTFPLSPSLVAALKNVTPELVRGNAHLADEINGLEYFLNRGGAFRLAASMLPEGWALSDETITVVVDYNKSCWRRLPKQDEKYVYVHHELVVDDFPSRAERTGKWKVLFRWLTNPAEWCCTADALKAIDASGFRGACRAELESVIDAHPTHAWVGFGRVRSSHAPPHGLTPYIYRSGTYGKRIFRIHRPSDRWGKIHRFLLACEWSPVES